MIGTQIVNWFSECVKNNTMKTIKITSLLILSFFMSIGLFAESTNFIMEEEAYINDIPFNTAEVSESYLFEMAMAQEFEMEEEGYIDDIPFDTECIAADCLYFKAMNVVFEMEEESYIDDIPFNTATVVGNVLCDK